ncbi:TonB family protein [Thalassotalea sp. M1531]|uniref:TonB family protein n=1 Tax=Thalassotalea algicola TaxID=2716224 RepID=A0A7Y0Q6G1_9GAMM|nr:energy transducer TonB [Thalassotalea algicola]NMP31984.1 TonB family protein [Thalassotalea algicola]
MKNNEFEQELNELYRQRKELVKAPPIDVLKSEGKGVYVPRYLKFAVLSLFGGVASFGVLALITHFAAPKVQPPVIDGTATLLPVEIASPDLDEPITIKTSLPPIPKIVIRPIETRSMPNGTEKIHAAKDFQQANEDINSLVIPEVAKPNVQQLIPLLKVLPEYPKSVARKKASGVVRLSYEVNAKGEVINIKVEQAQGERLLRRAAQKALSQWRYPKNESSQGRLEVLFDFTVS